MEYENLEDLNARINTLQQQLEATENKKKEMIEMLQKRPEYAIAEILHSKQCRSNHTDQCEWHYETWDTMKQGGVRESYLTQATQLFDLYREK